MGWTIHVDRGGTFTDVVALDPDGRLVVGKHLSALPGGADPIEHATLGRAVDELRIGTTVATNALLEGRGERVLLLVTRGFGDLLSIGSQERASLFALQVASRRTLHDAVVEIDERVLHDGTVRKALDPAQVRAAVGDHRHVAICFLHGPLHPAHERLAARAAREAGATHVTVSHEAAPVVGAVRRGDTTVADAFLTPGLRDSVTRAARHARTTLCMQSSGGLVQPDLFRGQDAVLSGPAGGIVAARAVGHLAGHGRVVGFDMGGTSTDVCRCGDALDVAHETRVTGLTLAAPALQIETVAAGGGSLLGHVDGRFVVGPRSAGADPGPACYGRGGPATVTDANVVLGRILPEHFPHLELDVDAARAALSAFGDPVEAATGFLTVAVDGMAAAIRRVTVARGHDVRDHALVAFGGAGGGHACAVARALGVGTVIVPPLAGVLSAWGLGLAAVRRHAERPVAPGAAPDFDGAEREARQALTRTGRAVDALHRRVDVRTRGQDEALTVPWCDDWRAAFHAEHRRRYGFAREGAPVELVTARVEAVAHVERPLDPPCEERPHDAAPQRVLDGLPVFVRAALEPGARLPGPALVVDDTATTVIEDGWRGRVDGHRQLLLEDVDPGGGDPLPRWPGARAVTRATGRDEPTPAAVDPVTLQVLSNRFMAVAEQMGEVLRRAAHSTNIKERRDFSCAVFDGEGRLVANAPHIPVHLGAVGETVRFLAAAGDMRPGDAWLSNDPAHGGSHLPDLTVVTPVFRDGVRVAFVANRGHHADVGGAVPGSMPAHSTRLADEGAVLERVLLLRDGRLLEEQVTERLAAAGTRNLPERLGDLAAQVAANAAGARLLEELADERGVEALVDGMAHVLDHGEAVMADVVSGLADGSYADTLDDGSVVRVALRARDGRATVDFSGTSPAVAGNRNAPRSVTRAAVLYVFRTLAGREIPLNEGCMRVLDVVIPPGSLLDPPPGAAVVGGNVETSQRVVDVLYGALGVLGASQGTMNNLTFGDGEFGYYETIGGGAGAGFGFDGASAVQTHMTNTRITDPEVLEARFPVIVRRFAIRRGSGGDGVWRGGDGVVRELEFTRPLEVSLLAERRVSEPFGLRAGAGARGRDELSSRGVVIHTPGGGGYSPSGSEWAAMAPADARRLFREGRWTGDTRGIALGAASRSRLLVVPAAAVDRVLEGLPPAALRHRGRPGDPLVPAPLGPADLRTDLPAYHVPDGRGGVRRTTSFELAPDHVCLLIDEAVTLPPVASPGGGLTLSCGAPGCRYLA